jgi:hypothetical protein
MILQEFRSKATQTEKLEANHKKFEQFIKYISEENSAFIENGELLGPINNSFTSGKNLFIGYYSLDLE